MWWHSTSNGDKICHFLFPFNLLIISLSLFNFLFLTPCPYTRQSPCNHIYFLLRCTSFVDYPVISVLIFFIYNYYIACSLVCVGQWYFLFIPTMHCRQMMNTTYPEQCSWIWSLGSSTVYWIQPMLTCLTRRTYTFPRMVEGLATTGVLDIHG